MSEPGSGLPPVPMEPLRALDPRTLGKWTILGRLGTGGMGVAFLAEADGEWAVVKMIRSDLADDRTYRARIARELEAMQLVEGPFTASLLEEDLDGDPAWFAMEFIPGMTLARHVTDDGPMDPFELGLFARSLADVLNVIHGAGIVHRDLKPSNIMLSPTGPRIIDFGIADLVEGTQLTRTGSVLGSTGWLAPEQVTGDPVSAATDVHAWGLCVLYAATGQAPFGAETASSALYRVLELTPDVPDSVPEPLRALVEGSLAKDPTRRPSLERITVALAAAAPPPPPVAPVVPAPVIAPTTQVSLTEQWTEEKPPLSSFPPPVAPPPAATPPAYANYALAKKPTRRVWPWLLLAGGGLFIAFIVTLVALASLSSAPSDASASSSTSASASSPGSSSEPGSASASPSAVELTYSVRVGYANSKLEDTVFPNTLDWEVDLCSTDTELLRPAIARTIRLWAKDNGDWVRQKAAADVSRGGRCGKSGVHVIIPVTEPAPAASRVDKGWSECRTYRTVLPETKTFAKTYVDMCVRTKAEAS